jgi:DNA helicase TIP49 (TBP-interacting protein)
MANLTEEELKIITDLQKEFVEKKVQLGDAVIVQHNLMSDVNILRAKFSQEEQKLIKKYGEDSVINLKTGEVTKNKK